MQEDKRLEAKKRSAKKKSNRQANKRRGSTSQYLAVVDGSPRKLKFIGRKLLRIFLPELDEPIGLVHKIPLYDFLALVKRSSPFLEITDTVLLAITFLLATIWPAALIWCERR